MKQSKQQERKKLRIEELGKGENVYDYVVGRAEDLTLILFATKTMEQDLHVRIHLAQEGARVTVVGLFLVTGKRNFSLHTSQLHEAPETTSNLLVKTVLADEAKFLYDGAIRVERSAQKTDAYQRNENLLLSPQAHAESKPTLEILANDVRCTHGATIGSVNEEQLWYLTSRGISNSRAKALIVRGFLASPIAQLPLPARQTIYKHLWQTL